MPRRTAARPTLRRSRRWRARSGPSCASGSEMQMLGKAGVKPRPTAPAPSAPPLNEFLPKAAWRRPE